MRAFSAVPSGLDPRLEADPRLESLGYFQKSLRDTPKSEMRPSAQVVDYPTHVRPHPWRLSGCLLVPPLRGFNRPKQTPAAGEGKRGVRARYPTDLREDLLAMSWAGEA